MPLTSVYQKSKKNYADKRAKQKPCKDFFFTGHEVVLKMKYGRWPYEIRRADEIHSCGMDEIFADGKCCGACGAMDKWFGGCL
ncbi:MAG: hypothetical protein IIY00_06410 [Clostridia bacterium]|nr:hypothetical protein [Clostridia bacterium]